MGRNPVRALSALVAVVSLHARLPLARAQQPAQAASRATIDTVIELASFDSAWTRVRDSYYDPTMHGLDWNRVRDEYRPLVARARTRDDVRSVIGRMLATLGDSHLGVVPAEEVPATADAAPEGVAGDAGFNVRWIGGDLVVSRLDSTGPAKRAGLQTGWIVDQVDSIRVESLLGPVRAATTDVARRRALARGLLRIAHQLQGAPGTAVRVTVRDDQGRAATREIVRREAPGTVVTLGLLPPLLTWLERRRVERPGGCIGVIGFNTWMVPISNAFEDAMRELRSCQGIVLDLRGNVGGVAAMIIGIAGHFSTRELLLGMVHMRGADLRYTANPRRVTRDGASVEPYEGRLALLVDELSASTTEIFAAALQHHGRARVFGDTTAGQALPSLLTRLPNGDGLLYAVADLTDPGGRRLEGNGVVPDERVPLRRASLLAGHDDAMLAALHWIDRPATPPDAERYFPVARHAVPSHFQE